MAHSLGCAPGAPTRHPTQSHLPPQSPAAHRPPWGCSQGQHQHPSLCAKATTVSGCCGSGSCIGTRLGTPRVSLPSPGHRGCASHFRFTPGEFRNINGDNRRVHGENNQCPRTSSAREGGAAAGDSGASGLDSDVSNGGAGAAGKQEGQGGGAELVARLKACGIAGVIAYGILNTVYYLSAFLVMVLRVSPLEKGAGVLAAARHCMMLLTLVWAGSQVTKVPRMLCALMMTPWVERVLQWLTSSNRVKSKSRALVIAAAVCFGFAALTFTAIILLWA